MATNKGIDVYALDDELKQVEADLLRLQARKNEILNSLSEAQVAIMKVLEAQKKPAPTQPIESLELDARTLECLKEAKINFVEELLQKTELQVSKLPNLGAKGLGTIKATLAKKNLMLKIH